jgi:hypothetical protein
MRNDTSSAKSAKLEMDVDYEILKNKLSFEKDN